MFKNDKGFGTAEALVAVTAVFMVMGMFIPMVIGMLSVLEKKENSLSAARVLYEHLEEEVFSGKAESSIYQRQGTVYQVIKTEGTTCVQYEIYPGDQQISCLKEREIE
jgi:hypothetical protein